VDYFEQLLKFLNDHYLTWVPEFINTLFETTEHRFYINLGKILQLLIEKVH
jgi:TorA maturation chaperone TorD